MSGWCVLIGVVLLVGHGGRSVGLGAIVIKLILFRADLVDVMKLILFGGSGWYYLFLKGATEKARL